MQLLMDSLETQEEIDHLFKEIYNQKHHFIVVSLSHDAKVTDKRLAEMRIDGQSATLYTREQIIAFMNQSVVQEDEKKDYPVEEEDSDVPKPLIPLLAFTPSPKQVSTLSPEIIKL